MLQEFGFIKYNKNFTFQKENIFTLYMNILKIILKHLKTRNIYQKNF